MSNVRIAFQNNTDTNGLILTPVWFGLHNGDFDLFDSESAASAGLELIAEDGGTGVLASEFRENQAAGVSGVITSTQNGSSPVFDPGEIADTIVDADAVNNGHLAFASMVLPSNDAFIGNNDSVRLFDENGTFLGAQDLIINGENVYDAGTEVNTEFDAPFAPDEIHGTGEIEGGVVRVHEGFRGSVGNPLEPGEEAFILGQQNIFGVPIDQQAADFTLENFQVGTVHVNEVAEQDGSSQNDVITGGREDDFINALGGDDLIEGGAGWDVVDGGDGEDTYIIRSNLSQYEISGASGVLNVTNKSDDSDLLTNIEHIQFDDAVVHVFSDGNVSGNTENVADNYVNLDQNRTDYAGTDGVDALVVNGASSQFTIGTAEDGQGVVLQSGDGTGTFLLNDYEHIVFDDVSVELDTSTAPEEEPVMDPEGPVGDPTDLPVDPTKVPGVESTFNDVQGETQFIEGTEEVDTFIINDNVGDYNWGRTLDGQGYVVWNGEDFDILYDVEHIQFNDITIDLNAMTGGSVSDIEGAVQHLTGTGATDTFVINASSSDYGWGATQDGEGIVVWNLEQETHDILYDFEAIQFNDATIDIDDGEVY